MKWSSITPIAIWCCLMVTIYGFAQAIKPCYLHYFSLFISGLILAVIIKLFTTSKDSPRQLKKRMRSLTYNLSVGNVIYSEFPIVEAIKIDKKGWLLASTHNQCLFIANRICPPKNSRQIFPSNCIRVYQHKQDANIIFGIESIGEAIPSSTKTVDFIKDTSLLNSMKHLSFSLIEKPLKALINNK